MRKLLFLAIAIFLCYIGATAQNAIDSLFATHPEVVFSFEESDASKLRELSRIVSIDKRRGNTVTAYANRAEFEAFLQKGYDYTIVRRNSEKAVNMATTVAQMSSWDRYPTYDVYLQMMDSFAVKYPALCRIDTIGTSVRGRLILCAVISDSLNIDQNEPQFFYSSTIHGDEVTGYVLMLRLIDYLLTNYGTNAEITSLVNNTRIYINPLANPDGTYNGGNSSVTRARRYNANSVDLNRNYPDPWGSAPLNPVQRENTAMINYISNHHLVMSANLHGGAEIVNFPWDSYTSREKSTADNRWWQAVGRKFVDSCRAVRSGVYTSDNSSGIIVGGDWYVINNGRQDYVNYYHHCREATIEVSEDKTLSTSLLPTYWNFHKTSLLNYIAEVHRGIHGMVVDSVTRQSLKALISIDNYDRDSSQVYSRHGHGDFYRMLLAGDYDVTATAPGYRVKTLQNVTVNDTAATHILFELVRDTSTVGIDNAFGQDIAIHPNPCRDFVEFSGKDFVQYTVVNALGVKICQSRVEADVQRINTAKWPKGIYIVEFLDAEGRNCYRKIVKR
jgi:hypothetical protein